LYNIVHKLRSALWQVVGSYQFKRLGEIAGAPLAPRWKIRKRSTIPRPESMRWGCGPLPNVERMGVPDSRRSRR